MRRGRDVFVGGGRGRTFRPGRDSRRGKKGPAGAWHRASDHNPSERTRGLPPGARGPGWPRSRVDLTPEGDDVGGGLRGGGGQRRGSSLGRQKWPLPPLPLAPRPPSRLVSASNPLFPAVPPHPPPLPSLPPGRNHTLTVQRRLPPGVGHRPSGPVPALPSPGAPSPTPSGFL